MDVTALLELRRELKLAVQCTAADNTGLLVDLTLGYASRQSINDIDKWRAESKWRRAMTSEEATQIEGDLIGVDESTYGDHHRAHTMELYKLYLGTMESVSDRRQKANSFFLTINTAVVALTGYVPSIVGQSASVQVYLLVPLAGVVMCYAWYRILRSYRGLNRGKFRILHLIECHLPLRPFDAEWTALARGDDPRLYRPLGITESIVPWVFLAVHVFLFVVAAREWLGTP